MPRFHREFPDKIRFYDEVLKPEHHRLFVRTTEAPPAGTRVEVEIVIGSDPRPFVTRGRVAARRTRAGGIDPGVWVQLDDAEALELCRVVEIGEGEAGRTTTRRFARLRRSVNVAVEKPFKRHLQTVNISQGGICVAGLLGAPVGQTVALTAELPEGKVRLFGRVAWMREDVGLTGIEFRFQDQATRARVVEQVCRMAEEESCSVYARPSLLLVDDDLATLQALARTLEARGYGTMTAATGAEALSVARRSLPALILLDVLLPGMNGLEVCRVLKLDAETSRIPVVLTSALGRQKLKLVVEEAGGLVGLAKPYRYETLETLIDQVLEHARTLDSRSGGQPEPERSTGRRTPTFLRCLYQSDSLHTQVYLREAWQGGGFLTSYWGDPPGTRATLTCMGCLQKLGQLVVEVVHRRGWGLVGDDHPGLMPGMGVRIVGGPGAAAFDDWIAAYEAELREKPIVFVIDDDSSHLEIMDIALRHAGFAVVTLDSPLGAIDAISMARPALVIVDFMMPGLEGGRLCQQIKTSPDLGDVPVWIYSSLADDRMAELAEESGADGFIRKGMRPTEIVARVKHLLEPSVVAS